MHPPPPPPPPAHSPPHARRRSLSNVSLLYDTATQQITIYLSIYRSIYRSIYQYTFGFFHHTTASVSFFVSTFHVSRVYRLSIEPPVSLDVCSCYIYLFRIAESIFLFFFVHSFAQGRVRFTEQRFAFVDLCKKNVSFESTKDVSLLVSSTGFFFPALSNIISTKSRSVGCHRLLPSFFLFSTAATDRVDQCAKAFARPVESATSRVNHRNMLY